MGTQAGFSSNAYSPDNLLAGNADLLVGKKYTVIAGQNLVRGTVAGTITASSKLTLSLSASGDGSEVPDLIIGEDCDATAGDKEVIAYSRGDFNQNALTIGAGHTIASINEGLRLKGLILVDSVGA